MNSIRRLLHSWFGECEPVAYTRIETGWLKEPDDDVKREVKIKMTYVTCSKCEKMMGVYPGGVVYDPKYDGSSNETSTESGD